MGASTSPGLRKAVTYKEQEMWPKVGPSVILSVPKVLSMYFRPYSM